MLAETVGYKNLNESNDEKIDEWKPYMKGHTGRNMGTKSMGINDNITWVIA